MKLPEYTSQASIPANPVAARGNVAAVGTAFEAFGKLATQAGQLLSRADDRAAALEVTRAEAETRTEYLTAYADLAKNAGDDTPDFQATALARFDEIRETRLAAASDRARPALEARLAAERAGWAAKARDHEDGLRNAKALRDLAGTVNEGANQVRLDDTQFAPAYGAAVGAIRASGLDRAKQDAEIARIQNLYAVQSYQGLLERDPARVQTMMAEGQFKRVVRPEQWDAISDAAKARVDQALNSERALVRGQLNDHLASLSETGQGIPGFASRIAALPPEERAEVQGAVARAQKVHSALGGLDLAAPEQLAATVERFRPRAGATDYAAQNQTFDAVQRRAAAILKARADDPAGYVAARDPAVREAAQAMQSDLASPDQRALAAQTYIDRSLAAQAALGIPESDRRSLPKDTARRLAAAIESAAPEAAADLIEQNARAYGPRWRGVFADLVREKLPDEYATLAMLDGPGDAHVRTNLVQAMKSKADFETVLPPASRTQIDRDVQSGLADWTGLEAARGGTGRNAAAVTRATQLLAYRYAAAGTAPGEAAAKAAREMVLDRWDLVDASGFALYAPKGLGDGVETEGRRILAELTADRLVPPPSRPGEKLTEEQRGEAYLAAVRRGRWVLDEAGDGAVLLDPIGQPVRTATGRLGFKFDALRPQSHLASPNNMGIAP